MGLRERIDSLIGQARSELAELVAIRSVADPRQFHAPALRSGSRVLSGALDSRARG